MSRKNTIFQFYINTISTKLRMSVRHLSTDFNSTLVRLALCVRFAHLAAHQNFNSTLVRLALWGLRQDHCRTEYFNSTLVRLARCAHWIRYGLFNNFNSTLVRLAPNYRQGVKHKFKNFNSTLVRLALYSANERLAFYLISILH